MSATPDSNSATDTGSSQPLPGMMIPRSASVAATFIKPHTLVRTVPMAIKLHPNEDLAESSDSDEEEKEFPKNASYIEPFHMQLPIPPNSHVFNSKHASRRKTPIADAPDISISHQAQPTTITKSITDKTQTKNSVNLYGKSLGYVYEDSYDVDNKRKILSKVLLVDEEQEKPKGAISESNNNEAANGGNNNNAIPKHEWRAKALKLHPEIAELSERIYPLSRAIALGRLYDAGRKEIKQVIDSEEDSVALHMIMHHLQYEGLYQTKKTLEEESGVSYKFIDVEGSLLHGVLKEAVKKAEKLYDLVIGDKYNPNEKRTKKILTKLIDEQLADLGFEEEETEADEDINIWDEVDNGSTVIVEVEPITKKEHFQAGSLNKIIERLTTEVGTESNFCKNFLMTYQSFTTPEKVLNKLIQRFQVPKSKTMSDAEYSSKKSSIQPKVCFVIKAWIESCFSHFNAKLLQRLIEFIETHVNQEPALKSSGQAILSLIEKKKSGEDIPSLKTRDPPDPKVPDNIFNQNLFILDVNEEEIARQITIIEFETFKEIQPVELLNLAWSKPKLRYRAPNVILMTERFNNLSMWFASLIVTPDTSRERSSRMKKVIKIAEKLRALNNFNSLQAVLSALSTTAVSRLKVTQEELPRELQQSLASLLELMNSKRNWKAYRDAIHAAPPPRIPFLGGYLSDLTFLEEGSLDYIKTKDNVMLINWEKRERCADIIQDLQKYQQHPYNFAKVHQINVLLHQMKGKVASEDILLKLSYDREPRHQ